jgi:outer membrane protein assembly factor BamB
MNDKRILIIILIPILILLIITQNYNSISNDIQASKLGDDKLIEVDQNHGLFDSNTGFSQKLVSSNTRSIEPKTSSGSPRKTSPWPMFLFDAGRTGNGSSNAPKTNSILWSTPDVGGNGYPSVSVAEGKVFVHKGAFGILYALFENNGTIIWNKTIGLSGRASSTPAVVNGKVYVVGDKLYCFDANSGTELWNHSVDGFDIGTSSPVVTNGKVFVNSQTLYCIDANKQITVLKIGISPLSGRIHR